MKIAVISDIHGNYDALVAVLKKAKNEMVEHLLILGDVVGYYYHPDKVLNILAKWDFDMIKGNHEDILRNILSNPSLHESIRLKYGSGHQHAIEKLDNVTINSLIGLPSKKTVILDGVSFELNHGTPWDSDEYLYPDGTIEKFKQCNSKQHDFVLMGHTHYSFTHQGENSIILNPGSVGQSREQGGYAYWALVDTKEKSHFIKKTKYDTNSLTQEVNFIDPNILYNLNILTRKKDE